ncbi:MULTISPECIES: MBL fold metallo-hydrolase [Brevibacterium]|nr:MBL fold metallo-hydrolase [Brevibacterium casei]
MKVITLGTSGGPRWWKGNLRDRSGIATAIVVGDRFYLVDAGHGVGRRIRQAGLELSDLGGVFITHLHSDHTIDLPALIVFGMHELQHRADHPVPIVGPGQRGALPPRLAASDRDSTARGPGESDAGCGRDVQQHCRGVCDRYQ